MDRRPNNVYPLIPEVVDVKLLCHLELTAHLELAFG